jgi:predicted N-acetyltransferase YhbS
VVLLARLAVSSGCRGRGIGRGFLQDAILRTLTIADPAGIRALMTHPLDDATASFYLRFGFIPSPLRERQLLLLLKDARRLVSNMSV